MSGGEPFVKLWGSIRKSSVWLEPHHVFKLWIYMLTEADKHGFVEGSKYAIGHQANLTRDETDDAFARLEAPDPDSKTKEMEGRRIVEVDRGWIVVNKSQYRELRTPEQVATAERVRRFRERQQGSEAPLPVTDVTAGSAPSTSTSNSESVVEGEVQEREAGTPVDTDPVYAYCIRLAVAANKGLDQPVPRILPSTGSTRQAAEIIYGADIPIDFAEQAVFDIATRCKSKGDVRSLVYFTRGVIEAWERKGMADQVRGSKLRANGGIEPTRAATTFSVCPLCASKHLPALWEPHFRREHPTADIPKFTDHIDRGDNGSRA